MKRLTCLLIVCGPALVAAGEKTKRSKAARSESVWAGYHLLLKRAYLPAQFSEKTFDKLWRTWDQSDAPEVMSCSPPK